MAFSKNPRDLNQIRWLNSFEKVAKTWMKIKNSADKCV